MPFSEARGPTHARHLAATLYRNEDLFFQIDSHSTFRQARHMSAAVLLPPHPDSHLIRCHMPHVRRRRTYSDIAAQTRMTIRSQHLGGAPDETVLRGTIPAVPDMEGIKIWAILSKVQS